MQWFSNPQETREAAEALHQPQPMDFSPAAVFKTPDGFVMGLLRLGNEWPPHSAIANVEELTGYEAVSTCAPLLGIWSAYEEG